MKVLVRALLFMSAMAVFVSAHADGTTSDTASSKSRQCEEPQKPINQEKLRNLAKTELAKQAKADYTEIDISWGRNSCAWLVIASKANPGPGEHMQLLYSNRGRLLQHQGGY
jgi:hypothetical protein